LAGYLLDPDIDPDFGREILLTLARIGPEAKKAVPILMAILEDVDNPLRPGAAYALAKLGAKQAVPLLIRALPKDDGTEMRFVAPVALVLLNPENDLYIKLALPRLIELLGDESGQVRHEAAATLARIGPKAAAAVPELTAGLEDRDPAVRSEFLAALGAMGPAAGDALPAILKSLADADYHVRYAASYVIGQLGPAAKEAIPVLQRNVQGRDEFLQIISAWALVRVDPKREGLAGECLGPLTRALKLPDSHLRKEAVEALGLLGSAAAPAAPAIKELAHDPDEAVRKSAAEALKAIEG